MGVRIPNDKYMALKVHNIYKPLISEECVAAFKRITQKRLTSLPKTPHYYDDLQT